MYDPSRLHINETVHRTETIPYSSNEFWTTIYDKLEDLERSGVSNLVISMSWEGGSYNIGHPWQEEGL